MPTANVSYNAATRPPIKTVWYDGTDTLVTGDALCYDTAAQVDADAVKDRLGSRVVQPATANLSAFAGVVSPGSNHKQGPCYIEIHTPRRGEFVQANVKANATAFTTALGPADGSYALAAKTDSGLNLPAVALAGETANSGTTAAVKRVMLL